MYRLIGNYFNEMKAKRNSRIYLFISGHCVCKNITYNFYICLINYYY